MLKNEASIEKLFKEQLKRLRTDHIDYYLMHMLFDVNVWNRLKSIGIESWIAEKKKTGAIRNIGFSYHGETEMFLRILDAYDWDFCQIQYNYLDEHTQAGRRGLQAAARKGIPVIIMEPLRGGKLVNLPDKAKEKLASGCKGYTPAELGLRWLWNQPEVTCVLSGMNSEDMVNENIRIASEAEPWHLTEEDMEIFEQIKQIIREREKVGCTGCRYCMPCPRGVDIPGNFYYYNLMYMEKRPLPALSLSRIWGCARSPVLHHSALVAASVKNIARSISISLRN